MNVYEKITQQIIAELEKGTIPWRKPWFVPAAKNFISGKEYKGVNRLLLGMRDYRCEYWATFKQVASLGGCVRRGEKGTQVVYSNSRL